MRNDHRFTNPATFLYHQLKRLRQLAPFVLLVSALAFLGCEQVDQNRASASSSSATVSKDGKIPITTSSEEARKEYLAGRDLQEKLRITDSIAHFDKALTLDPNFALAELNRANG